ncbi:hypothetical protein V8G54_001037 [Vigna mungo]|uniref:Uncharacterized protein n=1 Tax=Vigna mungo TaxID=3915 RepID=A0AAQ3P9S5_VIGMU
MMLKFSKPLTSSNSSILNSSITSERASSLSFSDCSTDGITLGLNLDKFAFFFFWISSGTDLPYFLFELLHVRSVSTLSLPPIFCCFVQLSRFRKAPSSSLVLLALII